jgi:ketosteroid isomerase-like protein
VAEDMERAVRTLREAYDAFNRGDFDTVVGALHPEVEWHRVADWEDTLYGREAVRAFMAPDVFTRQATEVEELTVHGEKMLVRARFIGVTKEGVELSQVGYQLWTVRDGLAAKLETFSDEEEALAAARG